MTQTTPEGKDETLWEIARRRASFRTHCIAYIIVNALQWSLWLFLDNNGNKNYYPWPIWTTLGWGVGLAFHFASAYLQTNSIEKEYQKLQNK